MLLTINLNVFIFIDRRANRIHHVYSKVITLKGPWHRSK